MVLVVADWPKAAVHRSAAECLQWKANRATGTRFGKLPFGILTLGGLPETALPRSGFPEYRVALSLRVKR